MSEFHVRKVTITNKELHPNADSLSITNVEGYPVVIRTEDFQLGDQALYIPVDALLDVRNPRFSFLTSRTNETGIHRVKAAKIRGIFSMGLLIPWEFLIGDNPQAVL